jgi:hypothetical protein
MVTGEGRARLQEIMIHEDKVGRNILIQNGWREKSIITIVYYRNFKIQCCYEHLTPITNNIIRFLLFKSDF